MTKKNLGGRPTKMTPETIKKLEDAFLLGCSDEEACFYADIHKQTLYNYQDKNPEFIDRKERLKQNPFFKARLSVISGFEESPELALKYLERKKKDEFSPRSEFTGKNGETLTIYHVLQDLRTREQTALPNHSDIDTIYDKVLDAEIIE